MWHSLFRHPGDHPGRAPGRNSVRSRAMAVSMLLGIILAMAGPAAGGARPFDPGPTLEELSPVAARSRDAGLAAGASETELLKAGILCVAWARDMIGQHWGLLDGLDGPGTWSQARQQLWMQVRWVEEYETRQLRPVIDADSQQDLLGAWWPDGVATPAGSEAAIRMHRFCMALPGLLGTVDPRAPPGF